MTQASQLARVRPAGRGYVISGVEYTPGGSGTPGVPVSRTSSVPARTNTLITSMMVDLEKVQANTEFAELIQEPTREQDQGDLAWFLQETKGVNFLFAGLRASVARTALNVTAVGTNVTTDGQTDIPATGAFRVGEPIVVNPGASEEYAQVMSYSAGHVITTELLANAAAVNSPLKQPAGTLYAKSQLANGFDTDFPRLTLERGIQGKWSELYPGICVPKLVFKFPATGLPDVTASLYGSFSSSDIASGSVTAYDSTDEDESLSPFNTMHAVLAFGADPLGSGTSRMGSVFTVQDCTITYDNAFDYLPIQGNPVLQPFATDNLSCEVDINLLATAYRNDVLRDYVQASKDSQFFGQYWKNRGTAGSPDTKFVSLYVPNGRFQNPTRTDQAGSQVTYSHKLRARLDRTKENDMLRVFVSTPT